MGRLERRLSRLEDGAKTSREEQGEADSRQVMRRMTDEELRSYVAALRRAVEAGGFTEEDRPILERAEELYGEVRNEEVQLYFKTLENHRPRGARKRRKGK